MNKFTYNNTTYKVESLEPQIVFNMIAADDLTDEEAQKLYYGICKALGITLTPWVSRAQQVQTLKERLAGTDYIAIKASEGCDVSEYGEWKAKRQALRDEINRLEGLTDAEYDAEMDEEWSN